jgi:hypothetical protein
VAGQLRGHLERVSARDGAQLAELRLDCQSVEVLFLDPRATQPP